MPRISKEIKIQNSQGLHARPAAIFVQIASKYNSKITVIKDKEKVNGKSIMGILTLGIQNGCPITLEADGDDAVDLLQELEVLLAKEQI